MKFLNHPRLRSLARSGPGYAWGYIRQQGAGRRRPMREWLEQRLLLFLSAGVATLACLIVALILIVFSCIDRLHEDSRRNLQAQTTQQDLHEMVLLVSGAESSQRGYLLSGDASYLQPYAEQQRALEVVLRRLNNSQEAEHQASHRLANFEALIRSKFSEMESAIDNAAAGHPLPPSEMLRSERGGELTRQLHMLDRDAYAAQIEQNLRWSEDEGAWEAETFRNALLLTGISLLCTIEIGVTLTLYLRRRRSMDRELFAARDSAVEANRAKSRFLAASSHDMRQPLHALNLLLRTLERRLGESSDTSLVTSARAAAASMARMFDGLLEVSRLDAGIVEARPESFQLTDLLNRMQTRFAVMAKEKGLNFDIDAPPVMLQTDRTLLENVLTGLLNNALVQTQAGSVTILARATDDTVTIDVCDTGRGIPAEEQDRIFEEFYRLELTHAGQGHTQGLGLGLSIIRRITKLLFAEIRVQSQPNQGSVFTISLPRVFPLGDTANPQKTLPPETLIDLRGKTMLLVDDEPLGREAMRCEITDWGMKVIPAADGEEAMDFLAKRQIKLDIAIVDCDPNNELSGPNLLDRMAIKLGIAVPAIIITSSTDSETLQELDAAGYMYLIKPVDETTLRRAVNAAMSEAIPILGESSDSEISETAE